jgi:hypothetical protein
VKSLSLTSMSLINSWRSGMFAASYIPRADQVV